MIGYLMSLWDSRRRKRKRKMWRC